MRDKVVNFSFFIQCVCPHFFRIYKYPTYIKTESRTGILLRIRIFNKTTRNPVKRSLRALSNKRYEKIVSIVQSIVRAARRSDAEFTPAYYNIKSDIILSPPITIIFGENSWT